MDLRKPKPVHGLRDFLKEVGIIVLGVSIALAAEQAVENWRQHRQYAEARRAMYAELSANLTNIRQRRKNIVCTVQRMHDIDVILDRAQSGQPVEAWIGRRFDTMLGSLFSGLEDLPLRCANLAPGASASWRGTTRLTAHGRNLLQYEFGISGQKRAQVLSTAAPRACE